MSEDALIRRMNLRALKLTANQLSERVGGRYTYWRDMLVDDKKSFGERVARKIEYALNLPRGSMDQPDSVTAGHVAEEVGRPYSPPPPGTSHLSKRATILAMMFDELKGEEEKTRAYILCQQILLGFDPDPAPHAAAPTTARQRVK